MRYVLYHALYNLYGLREKAISGELTAGDLSEIGEILDTVEDMTGWEAHVSVGTVLFDDEEAQAISQLRGAHKALYRESSGDITSNGTDRYLKILGLGAECLSILMSEGRGLPGWNPDTILSNEGK